AASQRIGEGAAGAGSSSGHSWGRKSPARDGGNACRPAECLGMPNDAKLGMAIGVGLIITVAAFFARKDVAAVPVHAAGPRAPISTPMVPRPGDAEGEESAAHRRGGRSHTVQDGDTLISLAQRYYGDRSKSVFLFRANQDRLLAPDRLPVGAVLRIPDLPEEDDP